MSQPLPPANQPALIRSILNRPLEVVHGIMDNLPLRTILTFISAKIPELNQTILSHQGYGYVFLDQDDLDSVADHFILYRKIRAWYREELDCGYLDLNSLATKHPRLPKWTVAEIRRHIGTVIDNACKLTAEEEEFLTSWSSTPIPPLPYFAPNQVHLGIQTPLPPISESQARWNWIQNAIEKYRKEKASHWLKAADLIVTYPGKLVTKKQLDPGQGNPRPNVQHIAKRFRTNAKYIMEPRSLAHSQILHPWKSCAVHIDGPILVPYDRFEEDEEIHTKLAAMSISGPPNAFKYPEDITTSIKIVLAGLFQVYASSPLHIVHRIDWSPSPSTTEPAKEKKQKPVFRAHLTPVSGIHLCPVKRKSPHDPRELEWLEAFLKVVTWIEANAELLGVTLAQPDTVVHDTQSKTERKRAERKAEEEALTSEDESDGETGT